MNPASEAQARSAPTAREASTGCPEYPAGVESLLGVLLYQREHLPERIVLHRVGRQRSGLVTEPLAIGALVDRAARSARVLAEAGVSEGDRVILSLSDPHDFVVAFFGAMAAGAAAVPLPTVAESAAPASFAARVRAVCEDCAPAAAVVEDVERFGRVAGVLPGGLKVLEPRRLESAAGEGSPVPQFRDRPASAPGFIQYTSGSTGAPKGVVVTHRNILANCRAIRDATGYTRADRMVTWIPLHHDMGLIGGLLTSIYCAAETWLMPPLQFLARPVTWLEAMSRYAATLTVGPTFAYSLCARKIPAKQLEGVDLSSLRLAYIGAEPIDLGTVNAFVERFVPYGLAPEAMYPVYGLAEATLAVSFPRPGTRVVCDRVDRKRLARAGVAEPVAAGDAGAVTFVSVGHPLPRHRVDIVGVEAGEILADRRVGELVVEGESVTPRYFGEDAAPARERLHTGDLAYRADGHLYIVDRIKDLVIVGGQNFAPSDIEKAGAEVRGVRRGRVVAFSSPGNAGTEELHVVAEASPEGWRPPAELEHDVRHAILHGVGLSAVTVTIVLPGSLERTSSGKVKRRACVQAHGAGALKVLRGRNHMRLFRARRWRALLVHRIERLVVRLALRWRGRAASVETDTSRRGKSAS